MAAKRKNIGLYEDEDAECDCAAIIGDTRRRRMLTMGQMRRITEPSFVIFNIVATCFCRSVPTIAVWHGILSYLINSAAKGKAE